MLYAEMNTTYTCMQRVIVYCTPPKKSFHFWWLFLDRLTYGYTGIWYIFNNRTYFILHIPSLKNNKGPLIKKCSTNKTHPYVKGCLNNSGFYKTKTRQAPGIYFNSP